jgi:hypothetical protein
VYANRLAESGDEIDQVVGQSRYVEGRARRGSAEVVVADEVNYSL